MKPFIEGGKPPTGDRVFYNNKYQVIVKYDGHITILSIRREDRRPIMDWRDLQWIKNMILGKDVEAVQLFPRESRLVDTANQYYLYAFPAGFIFPFGMTGRLVAESIKIKLESFSEQRPFAEHVRPDDLSESEKRISDLLDFLIDRGSSFADRVTKARSGNVTE